MLLQLLLAVTVLDQAVPPRAPQPLANTSWQLVTAPVGRGRTLDRDERSRYVVAFGVDGRVTVRLDCNRGSGVWKSTLPGRITISELVLTRAACAPGSLHDELARDLPRAERFAIQGGQLRLSVRRSAVLFVEYVFEPAGPGGGGGTGPNPDPVKLPVVSSGLMTYACTRAGGGRESLSATFYETQPTTVIVEFGGRTRPAFRVDSPTGVRYIGTDLVLVVVQGDLTVTWSGADLNCRRR